MPSKGFLALASTADKASTAMLPPFPDSLEGIVLADPWDGKAPLKGFGLDESAEQI